MFDVSFSFFLPLLTCPIVYSHSSAVDRVILKTHTTLFRIIKLLIYLEVTKFHTLCSPIYVIYLQTMIKVFIESNIKGDCYPHKSLKYSYIYFTIVFIFFSLSSSISCWTCERKNDQVFSLLEDFAFHRWQIFTISRFLINIAIIIFFSGMRCFLQWYFFFFFAFYRGQICEYWTWQ